MPYKIIKKKDGKYKVINAITHKIHAKNTIYVKALKQIRLMEMMDSKKKKWKKNLFLILIIIKINNATFKENNSLS